MRTRLSVFSFSLLLMISHSAIAGSFYSQKGIGLVNHFASGRSIGMGGIGLSIAEPLTVNYLNPATLVAIPISTLSGNFLHEGTDLKNATQDAYISETNVSGFQFVVPLKRDRIVMSIGAVPYSGIEYTFTARDSIGTNGYDEIVIGDGGVNTAFLSFSAQPVRNLYLGITGLFYFGTLRNIWRIIYDSTQFLNTQDEVTRSFTAGNIRFGFLYKVRPFWNIGGVITPPVTLDANTSILLRRINEFTDLPDTEIELPVSFGIGTSFDLAKKLTVGIDYFTQRWSSGSEAGFENDSQRIGLGLEFSGRGGARSSYFSRVAVRAGFYYHDLGLVEESGQKVTETFGSFGLGLPIKWAAAKLDLALEAGRRGSLDRNSFRETVVRFTASVTVGELWFYRGER
jgi:hypothetical protein